MIETISLASPLYPDRLKRIHNPPRILYVRGKLPSSESPTLCIVGSRTATPYAEEVVKIILASLTGTNVIIISGLARGVDTLAHSIALSHNIACVALPGSSIENKDIHPRSSVSLANIILEKRGCLLSEYPSGTKASRWTFPARNRIMAGLSDAVLVIEATEGSGTLITASHALNSNREVLAVPGPITSPLSYGTNRLISRGARIVCTANDVREALGLDTTPSFDFPLQKDTSNSLSKPSLTCPDSQLWEALSTPCTHDELAVTLGIAPSELLTRITELELLGHIHVRNGRVSRTIR